MNFFKEKKTDNLIISFCNVARKNRIDTVYFFTFIHFSLLIDIRYPTIFVSACHQHSNDLYSFIYYLSICLRQSLMGLGWLQTSQVAEAVLVLLPYLLSPDIVGVCQNPLLLLHIYHLKKTSPKICNTHIVQGATKPSPLKTH